MHESHIRNLRVFKTHLEGAIERKQSLVMNDWFFDWGELTSLLQAVVHTIRHHENYKHPNEDSMRKYPVP